MYDFIKDPTLYNLVRGPLVWIAFIVFIGGSIYRLYSFITLAKKDKTIMPFISLKYTLRSLYHWLIPFNSVNWRRRPVITIATFLFHIGLVFTPIFLLSHNILWRESWGITWWTLPEELADIMTLIVILCSVFLFLRRILAPEVKFVTSNSDYLLLFISFAPFMTGFLAYHQLLLVHKTMVILHILFGEIMLIAIPFTRLVHMFYFFLTRSFMGSQFALWHSRDW
jgi:nitrate reductase gamma subunit